MTSALKTSAGETVPVGMIIFYILVLASKKIEERVLPSSSIYGAFSELTKRHPEYLPDFRFYPLAGGIPHSRKLEDIFFRLGVLGLVPLVNCSSCSQGREEVLKECGGEALGILEGLSGEFIELLPAQNKEMPI